VLDSASSKCNGPPVDVLGLRVLQLTCQLCLSVLELPVTQLQPFQLLLELVPS